jgi:hypothetical protein
MRRAVPGNFPINRYPPEKGAQKQKITEQSGNEQCGIFCVFCVFCVYFFYRTKLLHQCGTLNSVGRSCVKANLTCTGSAAIADETASGEIASAAAIAEAAAAALMRCAKEIGCSGLAVCARGAEGAPDERSLLLEARVDIPVACCRPCRACWRGGPDLKLPAERKLHWLTLQNGCCTDCRGRKISAIGVKTAWQGLSAPDILHLCSFYT